MILFYSLEQHWDCANNWKTRYTMILWLLKEGFLGDCKIIWPSQLSWWCELATVESFYSRYFVSPFSSDKGSILKKSALETWDQYQYLGNFSPTPFLTQQQSIDNKLRLMLSQGRGRWAVAQILILIWNLFQWQIVHYQLSWWRDSLDVLLSIGYFSVLCRWLWILVVSY